ncbi:hypothetical protein MMSP_0737 [Mycobacterium sp. 012931]|nr:hypothetical protein MMSP_0737 [Mycobacterium sp. 012931]
MFDDVGAQVAALGPDGGWRGNAAQAYWVQNLAQSRRATLMADLDRLTAGLVSSQADAVKQARERLSVLIAVVLGVLVVCAGLELGGARGPAPVLPHCGRRMRCCAGCRRHHPDRVGEQDLLERQ